MRIYLETYYFKRKYENYLVLLPTLLENLFTKFISQISERAILNCEENLFNIGQNIFTEDDYVSRI